MKKKLSIFAPISIGNISVGFDSLGLALRPCANEKIEGNSERGVAANLLGDILHIENSNNGKNNLIQSGTHRHVLPENFEENIVWSALLKFNQALIEKQLTPLEVTLTLEKNIPISSGLGSSSCSIVAAVKALNDFYSAPFSNDELVLIMGELEGQITGTPHYDNLAPCFLGGMQLMLSDDISKHSQLTNVCRSIPTLKDCYWVIAYPDIEVSTKMAREVLPATYSKETVIQSCQNIAGFIDACYRQDQTQAMAVLQDYIAEPYRYQLLPNFKNVKALLLESGSLAVGISGSGPTIFAAVDSLEKANKAKQILTKEYASSSQSIVAICEADLQGARQI